MERYNKLVRDGIPDILAGKGIAYEERIASPEEYEGELVRKLDEEAREFIESGGDPEELADILEVIDAIRKLPRYADVEAIQRKKREERGGFEKRIILKGEK